MVGERKRKKKRKKRKKERSVGERKRGRFFLTMRNIRKRWRIMFMYY